MKKIIKFLFLLLVVFSLNSSGKSFSFIVLGDNRPKGTFGQPEVFREMIEEINKISPPPAFVINVGDMIKGSRNPEIVEKQWKEYMSIIKLLKYPIYHVAGNHEIRGVKENEKIYKEKTGKNLYYSFNYQDSVFIILDSEEIGKEGKITGIQFSWLKEVLEKNKDKKHKFVFVHRPLYPTGAHKGSSLDAYPKERDKLAGLLKEYSVDVLFCGHEHLFQKRDYDGLLQVITGGAGAPFHKAPDALSIYHFCKVEVNDKVELEVKKVGLSKEAKEEPGAKDESEFKVKGKPIFTFVQFSDSHIGKRPYYVNQLTEAVKETNSIKPAFVIISGDLVEYGLAEEYENFLKIMQKLKVPYYAMPGNHETLKGTWDDFKNYIKQPLYQSFVYKNCQFILLNGSKNDKKYYSTGYIDKEQMEWLKKELEKGKGYLYTFVFCHFPLEKKWGSNGVKNPERDEILSLLKKYKVAAYIFGHRHRHDYSYSNGTTHILCGALSWNFTHSEVGYRIYKVYPEFTTTEWRDIRGKSSKFKAVIPNPRKGAFKKKKVFSAIQFKPEIVKEKGLAGYFKFDEGAGIEIFDSSGKNITGKIYGLGDWISGWRDGKNGKAFEFDGVDDYVDLGKNFDMGKNDFTITFWVKKTDPDDNYQTILYKSKPAKFKSPGYGFFFRETGAQIKFTLSDGDKIIQAVAPPIKDKKWHFIAGVRGKGKIKLYVDGVLKSEVEDTLGDISNNENFVIGKRGYGNNPGGPGNPSFFCGRIDEVRIYKKALTDEEIIKIYRGD